VGSVAACNPTPILAFLLKGKGLSQGAMCRCFCRNGKRI
jgi:hypothetical protein